MLTRSPLKLDSADTVTASTPSFAPDSVLNGGVSISPMASVNATLNTRRIEAVQADRENTFRIEPDTRVEAAITSRRDPLRITLLAHNHFNAANYWNAVGEAADSGRPRQVLVTTTVRLK